MSLLTALRGIPSRRFNAGANFAALSIDKHVDGCRVYFGLAHLSRDSTTSAIISICEMLRGKLLLLNVLSSRFFIGLKPREHSWLS